VGHILAKKLHLLDGFLDWFQEIKSDEENPWIGPEIGQWTSGGDDNLAPVDG